MKFFTSLGDWIPFSLDCSTHGSMFLSIPRLASNSRYSCLREGITDMHHHTSSWLNLENKQNVKTKNNLKFTLNHELH
jgi:hypothetical protein